MIFSVVCLINFGAFLFRLGLSFFCLICLFSILTCCFCLMFTWDYSSWNLLHQKKSLPFFIVKKNIKISKPKYCCELLYMKLFSEKQKKKATYLCFFSQQLCQTHHIGFELPLMCSLSSYFQAWIIWCFWNKSPTIPAMRKHKQMLPILNMQAFLSNQKYEWMRKSGEFSEKEGRKKEPKSTLTRKTKWKKPSTLDLEILQGTTWHSVCKSFQSPVHMSAF